MDVIERVSSLLRSHRAVVSVRLVGSRHTGRANELSDFDLLVDTSDFEALAADLPCLLAPLSPLAAQWDRLSEEATYYMLMLPGAVKVDLVFERPPRLEPPWQASAETLDAIDDHFWDWILWLGAKQVGGNEALVRGQLEGLLFTHLLRPVGVSRPPASIAAAVDAYLSARQAREREFGVRVGAILQHAVLERLRSAGLAG